MAASARLKAINFAGLLKSSELKAAALKPGGLMIVADHSAKPGDGINVARTLHRIEESVLRREVEAAGFKLIEEGNFLRQPQDPRDFSVQPVTPTRPPVDEFVLKFQKPQ